MTTPELPNRVTPKVMAVTLDGVTMRIEDLPLELVDRVAKQCDVSWVEVVNTPMLDLVVMVKVLEAVAEHTGQPMPEGPFTPRSIVTYFTLVPDDVADPSGKIASDADDPDPFVSNGNATSTPG